MLRPPRLLIVPGLHGSGDAHWQSWLQRQHRDARRVRQRDENRADLPVWSERVAATLDAAGPQERWIAVAHSFGCLALAHHLKHCRESPIEAVLLVAPADPDRWGVGELLPNHLLGRAATLVYSENDPWMKAGTARLWARRWGAHALNLGRVGHINTEAGFGPLPLAQRWVEQARQRWAREHRCETADLREWAFAI